LAFRLGLLVRGAWAGPQRLSITFPAALAARRMPGLFPEQTAE